MSEPNSPADGKSRLEELKVPLEIVRTLVTLFLGLVGVINGFVQMIGDPQQSRIFSLAGYILLCMTLFFLLRGTLGENPLLRRAVLIGFYFATVGYFLWFGYSLSSRSVSLPFNHDANELNYFDFSTSALGWQDMVKWDDKFTNPQLIPNAARLGLFNRGVAYDLQLKQGDWIDYTIQYPNPIKADIVVASFFLPDTPDIVNNWVGLAAVDPTGVGWQAGSGGPIEKGKWTHIVLDLRGKYDASDVPLNTKAYYIQAVYLLEGNKSLKAPAIQSGLDDVAWYQTTGFESIREQRGQGRTLYDFEDDNLTSWTITSSRVQRDTLALTQKPEPIYRGERSLKLTTRLVPGGSLTAISTPWKGQLPVGVWIAQIYLPDTVPTGTSVWANFFTYTRSGWQDSSGGPLLRKGQWNTIIWDTRNLDWGGVKDLVVGIQIGAEDGPYQGPIYLDDIQIFLR